MTDDRILELLKLNDHATSGNGLALAFGLAIANEAASEEREACAKICDALAEEAWKRWKEMYHPHDEGLSDGAAACATDIRARSNVKDQRPGGGLPPEGRAGSPGYSAPTEDDDGQV